MFKLWKAYPDDRAELLSTFDTRDEALRAREYLYAQDERCLREGEPIESVRYAISSD